MYWFIRFKIIDHITESIFPNEEACLAMLAEFKDAGVVVLDYGQRSGEEDK